MSAFRFNFISKQSICSGGGGGSTFTHLLLFPSTSSLSTIIIMGPPTNVSIHHAPLFYYQLMHHKIVATHNMMQVHSLHVRWKSNSKVGMPCMVLSLSFIKCAPPHHVNWTLVAPPTQHCTTDMTKRHTYPSSPRSNVNTRHFHTFL